MDRLLFVDDEPQVLSALRRTFESAGFQVVTALDGEAGVRALETGPFEVVCSDYRMPGMSGAELFGAVRARQPHAFRILLTAYQDFDIAREAINKGEIHRYFTKPFETDIFIRVIREGCDLARARAQNAALLSLLQEKNRQLEELDHKLEELVAERTTNLLEGLTAALDFRDCDTQWHSRRVARYARRIGQQLGHSGQYLIEIEQGALLHDIGKIGVPDAVLRKTGPLTPEDWVEMKRHAEVGYHLLRGIAFLEPARHMVLQHHERWDGRGYPQALAGEAINPGARIFSVADAYDAITSDRPYRKAHLPEDAKAEVIRNSGTQFDPTVVAAFEAVPTQDFVDIHREIAVLEQMDQQRLLRDLETLKRHELR